MAHLLLFSCNVEIGEGVVVAAVRYIVLVYIRMRLPHNTVFLVAFWFSWRTNFFWRAVIRDSVATVAFDIL